MTREILTASRVYYVRSDATYTDAPGRLDTAAGACKTWQQAMDLVAALDLNGQTVTVQHGSEAGIVTFTAHTTINTMVGGGNLLVVGQSASGHTVVDSSSVPHSCFTLQNVGATPVTFQNITLQGGGGAGLGLIQINEYGTGIIGNGVRFGATATAHVWVHDNAAKAYLLGAAYEIFGSAPEHIFVNMGGCFLESCTVTLTGTPAFSSGFIAAINGGAVQSPVTSSNVFTGAATGPRYSANTNGVINTFGGGATYFPGNAGGSTATGGQYA